MTDVKSPQQFKLFMTGTEWKDSVTHSTDGPIASIWDDKLARASQPNNGGHGTGVRSSLERYGYQHDTESPPSLILEDSPSGKSMRTVQSEGHHRIAAAAALEAEGKGPYYIPTNYTDNTRAGRRARGEPRGVRMVHGANALSRTGEINEPTQHRSPPDHKPWATHQSPALFPPDHDYHTLNRR